MIPLLAARRRRYEVDDVEVWEDTMIELKTESEKKPAKVLRDWGLDMDAFRAKAKTSLEGARADLSEVREVLQQALTETKQIVLGLQKSGKPAAAEMKSAFERAWNEIEQGFSRAREKTREAEDPQKVTDDSGWVG